MFRPRAEVVKPIGPSGGWERAVREDILCRMGFRRRVGVCLALLAVSALLPARVHAHGALKRSRPAAGDTLRVVPRELRLEFSEAPELAVSMLRLLDPDF